MDQTSAPTPPTVAEAEAARRAALLDGEETASPRAALEPPALPPPRWEPSSAPPVDMRPVQPTNLPRRLNALGLDGGRLPRLVIGVARPSIARWWQAG